MKYMPEIKEGNILLIEDTCKNVFAMEKLFSMLKLADVFETFGGIFLGIHERFQDGGKEEECYVVREAIDLNVVISFLVNE